MAQWGRNDKSVTVTSSTTKETSTGAPIGTYTAVRAGGGPNAHFGNTAGTRANTDKNMFGNTTPDAFITGQAVGVFGVGPDEMGVSAGPVATGVVITGGTGYNANATVTLTATHGGTSAVANAQVTKTGAQRGRVTALNISTAGSGYITPPTVAIAAPALITFNGNSAVSNTNDTIAFTSANSRFQVGDGVTYAGNTLSTPGGLTDQTKYYVSFANTTTIALATTKGGANINLTSASGDSTSAGGATLQGETATGKVTVGGAKNDGVAHAGWVIRREGTGGRAGRVHYETLVAMGSLGAQTASYGTPATTKDASDDTVLPDA